MSDSDVSHVGFVVRDLEAAMERVSASLNISFLPVLIADIPILRQGYEARSDQLRLTWSRQGPTHVELIEAHPRGLYALPAGRDGFHHLGGFVDNSASVVDRLAVLGIGIDAAQHELDGRIIATYSNPDDLFGIRFEHISPHRSDDVRAWLEGGTS